ncbi:hypothetical protein [Paraferrimonas haliotis]|uniref:hypothetical protein n=1 Tax=Paraferrimonas haliotis TaxID=2013866 RepID=UPI000BA8F80B|nr:hypothetical protein [Paraferrimonas haliotis]
MRQSATPSPTHRRKRWNKHLKRRHLRTSERNFVELQDRERLAVNGGVEFQSTPIGKFLEKINKNIRQYTPKNGELTIKQPPSFCLLKKPEQTLRQISKIYKSLTSSRTYRVNFIHTKTKEFCIGAELLLGIAVHEAKSGKKGLKGDFARGTLPKSDSYCEVLKGIGVIKQLDARADHLTQRPEKIHVFNRKKRGAEAASTSSSDSKSKTADDFKNHINHALRDHQLILTESTQHKIKGLIGEILDNAEEHAGKNTSNWNIAAYLNNNDSSKVLEISMLNFGNSISQNMESASEFTKTTISPYIERNAHLFNRTTLQTIAAMQGAISSANNSKSDTRGNGTLKLIEVFENIFDEYQQLRKGKSCCEMNLISGSTVLRFDGSAKHKKIESEDGSETVYIPFNNRGINYPPESKYIQEMKTTYFPGVIINLRLPLNGSITPLKEGVS